MHSLQGKNVYITGGSSGIGLSFAKLAAKEGAHIIIIARNKNKLEEAKIEIWEHCAVRSQMIEAFSVDVCDAETLYSAVPSIVGQCGKPDILVCAAGIGMSKRFDAISDSEFRNIMDINVYGLWYTIKAFYPYMAGRKTNVVILSSLAGLIGIYGYSAYGTSKFAAFGLADCLRGEFQEQGIALSVICPPEVDTPLITEELKTISPKAKRIKRITGILSPDTVAKTMLKAIKKNTYMIVPGKMSRLSWFLHRLTGGAGTRLLTDIILRLSK